MSRVALSQAVSVTDTIFGLAADGTELWCRADRGDWFKIELPEPRLTHLWIHFERFSNGAVFIGLRVLSDTGRIWRRYTPPHATRRILHDPDGTWVEINGPQVEEIVK